MHSKLHVLAAACALVAMAGAAQAATTVYTSSASFLAQTQPGGLFLDFTQGAVDSGTSFTYTGGGFSVTMTSPSTVYRSGTIIGNNLPNETFTLTFAGTLPTEDRFFKRPFFPLDGTPSTAEQGQNTAPEAP